MSAAMMAKLWHLVALCWTWTPLCLPSRVHFIGTPQECEKAHFVPGYNLGGEGFDIVTMERKGAYVIDTETWKLGSNGTCRLFGNTYMNGVRQKVPVAVVDWRIQPKCSLTVSSKVFDSVETLVNDSTSSVSNDWKIGFNIPVDPSVTGGVGLGGSHSKQATFGMKKSKQDHYTFIQQSVSCIFYSYRVSTNPPLKPDFLSAVNALPRYCHQSESSYRNVIDTYGTHYITQIYLGGEIKAITGVKTCKATMNGLSATEINDCLTVEASACFESSASVNAMYKHCQAKKSLNHQQSFSSEFSERHTEVTGGDINGADVLFQCQSYPSVYKNWLSSLKTIPNVVRYNLKALHTLLPRGHQAVAGLKSEVEKYIKRNAVLKTCSERCKIGHRSSSRDRCACVCNSNANIKSNCCPTGKGLATLKVFKLYAKKLHGDVWTQTDGSVTVQYGNEIKRTSIISNNDNPTWKETFYFGSIKINMRNKLTFRIYDEDTYWNSDLLGVCAFDLRRGNVIDSCMLKYGTFFFSYIVECAPSLGGSQCQDYQSTPMSPDLAEVFHTRNGVLAGDREIQSAVPISQSDQPTISDEMT